MLELRRTAFNLAIERLKLRVNDLLLSL